MHKSLIDTKTVEEAKASKQDSAWIDLAQSADVEITSEDKLFPIEHALGGLPSTGWRAGAKGPQVVRLNFHQPTAIHRIQLHFIDRAAERSQEFAIYAKSNSGDMREVVRQQFTFSPGGSSEELEEYSVDLSAVTSLELRIDPDRSHDPTHSQHFAVLQSLQLA